MALLRPLGAGPPIALGRAALTLGRGAGGIIDPKMSREHVRFSPRPDEEGAWMVQSVGSNGCEVLTGTTRTILRPGSAAATMRPQDEICLLPGKHHFRLSRIEEPPLPDGGGNPWKRARPSSTCEAEDGGGSSSAAAGGVADGGPGSSSAGDVVHGPPQASPPPPAPPPATPQGQPQPAGEEDDWMALQVPQFSQPPKPAWQGPGGLGALQALALAPEANADKVYLVTKEFVVAYDVYPKARVHLLILPRVRLDGPRDLNASHAPMVCKMARLAEWLAMQIRRSLDGLAPLAAGFHAVPSMRQLHLHVLSTDLRSDALKNKKHFNSFTTDFFVSPSRLAADLVASGTVHTDGHTAEEEKLKRDMRCPLSGRPLKNMPAVKQRLAEASYAREILEHADGLDLVASWPKGAPPS